MALSQLCAWSVLLLGDLAALAFTWPSGCSTMHSRPCIGCGAPTPHTCHQSHRTRARRAVLCAQQLWASAGPHNPAHFATILWAMTVTSPPESGPQLWRGAPSKFVLPWVFFPNREALIQGKSPPPLLGSSHGRKLPLGPQLRRYLSVKSASCFFPEG